jgi:hypothetical protein
VVLTWIADPLFNLLLRFNPYGRLALTEEQRKSSNLVAGFLGMALLILLSGFVVGFTTPLLAAAAGCGLMVIPMAAIYQIRQGWPRKMMGVYAGALAVALVTTIVLYWIGDTGAGKIRGPLAMAMLISGGVFLLGILGVGWIANILLMWRVKR